MSPLKIVSVSLGSSSRDHTAAAHLLGRDFVLERRGTNGDLNRAREIVAELDGKVDAIGLGGIDLFLVAGARKYQVRDAAKLAAAAKKTPVVDGSGLKDTLERETIRRLQRENIVDFQGSKVLLTCAVDRFGMAEELVKAGADVTFGDFLFVLNWPIRLTRLSQIRQLGAAILPVACRLPFYLLYPTGDAQNQIVESKKHRQFFENAQIIAGDFLQIRRFLPTDMKGKTVLTNTVTKADIELLRERGAKRLVTTTPEFEGRSFGTNVMEGVFAALGAKSAEEYRKLLGELNWAPRVVNLSG